MTITLGTWIIPVILTVLIWIRGIIWANNQSSSGMFSNTLEFGWALICNTILSMFVWLVWLVLKVNGWA